MPILPQSGGDTGRNIHPCRQFGQEDAANNMALRYDLL
jgi:hypothetical protein